MSGKKKKNAKKKKEKIIYYDDNSTVADMSNVRGGFRGGQKPRGSDAAQYERKNQREETQKKSTAKEKWQTYVNAVKLMFPWMCVAIIIICVLYFVLVGFGRCAA